MTTKIHDTITQVSPYRCEFTYPAWRDSDEPKTLEVDGLRIEQFSVDQPELDFEVPFIVDDGRVVGVYPYLKVVPISQNIQKLKHAWLKTTIHLPML